MKMGRTAPHNWLGVAPDIPTAFRHRHVERWSSGALAASQRDESTAHAGIRPPHSQGIETQHWLREDAPADTTLGDAAKGLACAHGAAAIISTRPPSFRFNDPSPTREHVQISQNEDKIYARLKKLAAVPEAPTSENANVLELYLSSASLQHLGIYPLLDKLKTAADSGIYGPAKVKEVVSLLRDELRATTHRHTERVHALCSLVHLAISDVPSSVVNAIYVFFTAAYLLKARGEHTMKKTALKGWLSGVRIAKTVCHLAQHHVQLRCHIQDLHAQTNAFRRWQERLLRTRAALNSLSRRMLGLALQRWQGQHLKRVRLTCMAARILKKWSGACLVGIFCGWNNLIRKRRKAKHVGQKACLRLRSRVLAQAWLGWLQWHRHARRLRQISSSILARWTHGAIRSVWLTWHSGHMVSKRNDVKLYRAILRHGKSRCIQALRRWLDQTIEQRKLRVAGRKVMKNMLMRGQAASCRSWRERVADSKRIRLLLVRVVQRMSARRLAQAWSHFADTVSRLMSQRASLTQTVTRWKRAGMQKALEAWCQHMHEVVAERMLQVANKKAQDQIRDAAAASSDMAQVLAQQRDTLRQRILARLWKEQLSSAWIFFMGAVSRSKDDRMHQSREPELEKLRLELQAAKQTLMVSAREKQDVGSQLQDTQALLADTLKQLSALKSSVRATEDTVGEKSRGGDTEWRQSPPLQPSTCFRLMTEVGRDGQVADGVGEERTTSVTTSLSHSSQRSSWDGGRSLSVHSTHWVDSLTENHALVALDPVAAVVAATFTATVAAIEEPGASARGVDDEDSGGATCSIIEQDQAGEILDDVQQSSRAEDKENDENGFGDAGEWAAAVAAAVAAKTDQTMRTKKRSDVKGPRAPSSLEPERENHAPSISGGSGVPSSRHVGEGGVGLLLRKRPNSDLVSVDKVVRHGPADCDGRIRVGDTILRVNGADASGLSVAHLRTLIVGQPGSPVCFTIGSGRDKKMEVQLVRASEFSESLRRSRSMEPSGPRLPPTHDSKCAPACDEGEEHAWSAGPTAEAVTGEMANHNVVIQEIGDFLSHHCSNTIGAVNVGVSDFAGATAAVTTTALQVAGIGGIETSGDANKHERTTIPKTAMRVFTNGTAF